MALKFKPKPETATIDWVDGAKLKLKRPGTKEKVEIRKYLKDQNIEDETDRGAVYLEWFIVGWSAIEDGDSGKALEFNPKNRKLIFEALEDFASEDGRKALESFNVFVAGDLGN